MKRGRDETENPEPRRGLRDTLRKTFQPLIQRLNASFFGIFSNFFPYKISIPLENENVLLLAPQAPIEPVPVHRGPDLILVVNTQGETCTEACSTGKLFAMPQTIERMNITLLERVPCGVTNFSEPGNKQLLKSLQFQVDDEEFRVDDRFPQILQLLLQRWVRKTVFDKDTLKDPDFPAFKQEEGWRMVGQQTDAGFTYLERKYSTDKNYASVVVLYAKPGSPFTKGINLLKTTSNITRSVLFNVAKYMGHHNIIVLDSSCGVFDDAGTLTTDQAAELTRHYKALGLAGGKRKRKHRRKTRKINIGKHISPSRYNSNRIR